MTWKDFTYWKKGFIIGLIVGIIADIIMYNWMNAPGLGSLGAATLMMPNLHLFELLNLFSNTGSLVVLHLLNAVGYILWGTLIGWIVGKIRNK